MVVVVLLLIGFVSVLFLMNSREDRIEKYGITAEGRVVRLERVPDLPGSYNVFIDFVDDRLERHEALLSARLSSVNVGDVFLVRYIPGKYNYVQFVARKP